MIKNGIIETSVAVKESKIPNHGSSAVPKKYKRNAILGDLHRANEISSNFELEKSVLIKNILALISCTILFSTLLIHINKSANRYFLTDYLKKNIEKQYTSE